jgi:(p)ppGpp synthase/HD superfamily hydrolase
MENKPMENNLDIEFEEAIRLLVEYMPVSDENIRKPILAHDIRVGVYLYENNYSRDIILAGLLHDTLEFSGITQELIEKEFGENVLKLVRANTKDRSIQDSDERINESVRRCAENGEEALIVKTADILDSFKYYTKVNNQAELEYCRKNAEAIKKYKADNFSDSIFLSLADEK